MKPSKYKAIRTTVDGIVFDSRREAARWAELRLLERSGAICGLERQVTFELAPAVKIRGEKRKRPTLRFTADFRYVEDGETVVEDAKGFRGDTAFKIRQHLMATVHGIHVRLS